VTGPAAATELRQRLGSYDLVVVPTAHREFDAERLVREARLVLDMRNLTGPLGAQPHVIRL
jgi:UDP-N-acetyl-D-mannosaminuronate dehydrogenase